MHEIIKAHKFFCRKSQHYIMGNWSEYEEWFLFGDGHHGEFNNRLLYYYLNFIPSYIRFMYSEVKDLVRTGKKGTGIHAFNNCTYKIKK